MGRVFQLFGAEDRDIFGRNSVGFDRGTLIAQAAQLTLNEVGIDRISSGAHQFKPLGIFLLACS